MNGRLDGTVFPLWQYEVSLKEVKQAKHCIGGLGGHHCHWGKESRGVRNTTLFNVSLHPIAKRSAWLYVH